MVYKGLVWFQAELVKQSSVRKSTGHIQSAGTDKTNQSAVFFSIFQIKLEPQRPTFSMKSRLITYNKQRPYF